MKKLKAILAACMALTMLVGCGGGKTSTDGLKFTYTFEAPPKSLDSTVATDGTSFTCIAAFVEGLMMKDEKGNLYPAIAEDYDFNEETLTYTFKIRKDAKWDDGTDVTAHDFVYAWQRILRNGEEYGYMFGNGGANILNGQEISEGKMDADKLGATALDDKTLEVKLAAPCGYFLDLMNFAVFYPQNQAFVEKVGEDKYATSPETTLACGPFKVTEYVPGQNKVVYAKNETYWDADKVQLDELEISSVKADSATMGFETGDYDFVNIGYELVDKYKDNDAYYSYPAGYQYYLAFNFHNEALQNINIRKALSLALNRDDIANNVLKDGSLAAVALDPQGLSFKDGVDFTDGMNYLSYDLEEAQKCFDQGLKELGVSSITLELLYGNDEAPCDALATYALDALGKLNGLTLTNRTEPKASRLDDMTADKFEICVTRWGPDYADPNTYLSLFDPVANMSNTNYQNDTYKDLLNKIAVETDVDVRWDLMKEAEKVLMEDYACAPMLVKAGVALMNPEFTGIGLYPTGPNCYKYVTKVK